MTKLIIDPGEITREFFEAVDPPWEAFEKLRDGNLYIGNNILVFMRVGLHMKRPTQAIMSGGHFLRIRSGHYWSRLALHDLDPTDPNSALYGGDPDKLVDDKNTGPHWNPAGPDDYAKVKKEETDSIILDQAAFWNTLNDKR